MISSLVLLDLLELSPELAVTLVFLNLLVDEMLTEAKNISGGVSLIEGGTQPIWGVLANPERGAFCKCEDHNLG